MHVRGKLKRFGVRFAICLVVFGAGYVAIFGLRHASHNQPNTPAAKIVALRAALDQTLIDSGILAQYKQNDPASYASLSNLLSRFQSDVKALKTTLGRAPRQVTPVIHKQINAVISSENQIVSSFNARYSVLALPITYDPQSDLGKLDISNDKSKLSQRASAAQAGLKKAAGNTTSTNNSNTLNVGTVGSGSSLVTASTKQALLTAADCYGQLASQLSANQMSQAAETRAACIKNYPSARQKAIRNVLEGSFSTSYESTLKQTITPLLAQLSSTANKVVAPSTARSQSK
jgi:hypothetical protein